MSMSASLLNTESQGDDSVEEDLDHIRTSFESCYVWRYGPRKDGLRSLYAKAKREQWDGRIGILHFQDPASVFFEPDRVLRSRRRNFVTRGNGRESER